MPTFHQRRHVVPCWRRQRRSRLLFVALFVLTLVLVARAWSDTSAEQELTTAQLSAAEAAAFEAGMQISRDDLQQAVSAAYRQGLHDADQGCKTEHKP